MTTQHRQIILDTETTGLSPQDGHRIIEIGCIEMVDRQYTSRHFHHYIRPDREVDPGALKIHGITNEFLSTKAPFEAVIDEFLAYIAGAELIIHNAPFDIGFLNYEFGLLKSRVLKPIQEQCRIIDTLVMARAKHPGQKNSLDALCKRYQINNNHRQLHGALLDAEILADVYLAMTGGQLPLFQKKTEMSKAGTVEEVREIIRIDRTKIPRLKVIQANVKG